MAVSFKSATGNNASTQTVTLPSHVSGDIIVVWATGLTADSVPSAGGTVPTWITIGTSSAGYTGSSRLAYAVATANNHTSGTWGSGGGILVAAVLSGQGGLLYGGYAFGGSSTGSTTATAPAITLADASGDSQILHFFDQSTLANIVWGSASGYTSRTITGGATRLRLLTKDSTTSDGAVTLTTGTQNNFGTTTASLEITANVPASATNFFQLF